MRRCEPRLTVWIGLDSGEGVDGLDKLNMTRGINAR